MKIRKLAALILSVALFVLAFPSCGSIGSGKNDANTLTLNFGIRNIETFIDGISRKFPDINFEIEPTYCANPSGYLRKTLLTGNSSDIFYYTQQPDENEASEYLLDLSDCDFISNFDRSVINTYTVDGRIYSIPGPMMLRGMVYNKTLFEEHGWSKPESHQELVELCRRIRKETDDITPISMSFGGLAYPFSLVTTFSQAGFIGTPAGEEWEKRFKAGEASVAEGFGEGIEMTAELIDAGAFNAEGYIGVWDGAACNMEFAEGKAAMFIMWAGQSALLQMIENNPDYEYGFMPFYGKEDGEMIIGVSTNFTWGISKRLGERGNEKKLKNALRVMEWLSTQEAQDLMKTYMTDENGSLVHTSAEMLPLNTHEDDKSASPYFRELWEQAERGNKMQMIYSGYESVIVDGGNIIQDAILAGSSEGMAEKFISSVDSDYKDYLAGGDEAVMFEVTQDMSEAETAQLMANGINDAGLGDFALVTHTGRCGAYIENKNGVGVRYLAGKYTNQDYNIILGNMKNVCTVELTGKQVKQLISDGKRIYSTVDENKFADYPYYWAGIDVKQEKSGAAESVIFNGSELGDVTVYKVVFCGDDYSQELAESCVITDTGVNIDDLWSDYVSSHKVISSPEVLRRQ